MLYEFEKYKHAKDVPSRLLIVQAAKELDMDFGIEAMGYLQNYGYLAHKDIRLAGMTLSQGLDSDLIIKTKEVRSMAGWTWGYFYLEQIGEKRYAMCDHADRVYIADLNQSGFYSTGKRLGEYIRGRFEEADV